MDHLDLGSGGQPAQLGLKFAYTSLRRLEGLSELISLGLDALLLSSLVALPLAMLFGFFFPLIAAVCHFGQLAHDVSFRGHSDGLRPQRGADWTEEEPLV